MFLKLNLVKNIKKCCRTALTIFNISNLNSDRLFVNNHQDQRLSTTNFCLLHILQVTKQLPVSYLLLPKRYKDTNIIKSIINIQFCNDQTE